MIGRSLIAALSLVLLAACQPSFKANEAFVDITIAADGALTWNGEKVSFEEAKRRLRLEGARDPQPQIRIIPDSRARFENVMRVMGAAQRYGLTDFGVVGARTP